MNIKMKNKITTIAVFVIALAVFITLFLVIPFNKSAASWIVFAFTIVAFIASLGIMAYAFATKESEKNILYNYPIVRVGIVYLIAQLVVCVVISAIAAFIDLYAWIAVVLCILILAAAFVLVITTGSVRSNIIDIEKKTAEQTKATKVFRVDVAGILDVCNISELKKPLEALVEDFKYSDPVSCPETEALETEIASDLNSLRVLVTEGATEEAQKKITDIKNKLANRNRICKLSK